MILCGSLWAGDIAYDAGKRRDPFVPLVEEDVSAAATSTGLKLEGIIYDPGAQSIVMLSGKSYQKGDSIGDTTVVNIYKDHVVLAVNGEEKKLWIRTEEKS